MQVLFLVAVVVVDEVAVGACPAAVVVDSREVG
jgi:hypothetical protein